MAANRKQSTDLIGQAGVGVLIVISVLGCRSSPPQSEPKVSAAGNFVAPRPVPTQNVPEEQGWTVYTSPSGNYKLPTLRLAEKGVSLNCGIIYYEKGVEFWVP